MDYSIYYDSSGRILSLSNNNDDHHCSRGTKGIIARTTAGRTLTEREIIEKCRVREVNSNGTVVLEFLNE